jgi:hypothetical protein
MVEKEILDILIGNLGPNVEPGIVPSYLEAPYLRATAAKEAASLETLSPELVAALLRVAFTDEEEGVREAARDTLISKGTNEVCEYILWSIAQDKDVFIRDTVFDSVLNIVDIEKRLKIMKVVRTALKNDSDSAIKKRAENFSF